MTDTEIIIIADKVMGWTLEECPVGEDVYCSFWGERTSEGFIRCKVAQVTFEGERGFNPLTSDADCMMAWDKFSKGHETGIHHCIEGGWIAWGCGWAKQSKVQASSTDRRRAMCECMVKAVS